MLLFATFTFRKGHYSGTARVKWEEGVGDGRSVWPESLGLHAAYNGWHNGSQLREEKLNP